jgi:H+/Cl- antiporter ClcA
MRPHLSYQPNVPGKGIVASYSLRFWGLVVAVGVVAGLGAAVLALLLDGVQEVFWAFHSGSFLSAVTRAGAGRHVIVLFAAGVVAAIGGVLIKRVPGSGAGEISDGLWLGGGRLAFWRSQARGVLSIIVVGMGASLGREAAPQLAGAAAASRLSDWAKLPVWQRRLLVACGAGAGMAAIYNVPLGGALFAVEVLLGTLTLPVVLPAVAVTAIATAVAWIVVPNQPTYEISAFGVTASQVVWAVLIGPLAGGLAVGWVHIIAAVNRFKPRRWGRVVAPIAVFTALGVLSIAYPQLLGNGKDVVQNVFSNHVAVAVIAALLVLKPLATAACLGTGAPGGLFTPTLTLGVLFGALLGHAWGAIWPGAGPGSYAVIGGAAVLAASMQGPIAAVVLMLELTHHGEALMVPVLLAVAEATIVARLFGAPSIYSARLSVGDEHPVPPAPAGPLEPEVPTAAPRGTQ